MNNIIDNYINNNIINNNLEEIEKYFIEELNNANINISNINKQPYFHLLDGFLNENKGDFMESSKNFISNFNPDIFNLINDQYYCEIGSEHHMTTLFIKKDNDEYCLFLINSGYGINNHYSININNEILYTPYYGIKLNINQLNDVIYMIIYILSDFKFDFTDTYIYQYDHLITIYNILNNRNYFNSLRISHNFINNVEDTEKIKYFKTLFQIEENKLEKNKNKYDKIYNFLKQYTRITNIQKYINFNEISENFTKLKEKVYDKLKLNENIIKKIIPHYHDENIYIYPQQSGSCSWFSVYWYIILKYLFNNDIDTITNFIIKITLYCYIYILNITLLLPKLVLNTRDKINNFIIYFLNIYHIMLNLNIITPNLYNELINKFNIINTYDIIEINNTDINMITNNKFLNNFFKIFNNNFFNNKTHKDIIINNNYKNVYTIMENMRNNVKYKNISDINLIHEEIINITLSNNYILNRFRAELLINNNVYHNQKTIIDFYLIDNKQDYLSEKQELFDTIIQNREYDIGLYYDIIYYINKKSDNIDVNIILEHIKLCRYIIYIYQILYYFYLELFIPYNEILKRFKTLNYGFNENDEKVIYIKNTLDQYYNNINKNMNEILLNILNIFFDIDIDNIEKYNYNYYSISLPKLNISNVSYFYNTSYSNIEIYNYKNIKENLKDVLIITDENIINIFNFDMYLLENPIYIYKNPINKYKSYNINILYYYHYYYLNKKEIKNKILEYLLEDYFSKKNILLSLKNISIILYNNDNKYYIYYINDYLMKINNGEKEKFIYTFINNYEIELTLTNRFIKSYKKYYDDNINEIKYMKYNDNTNYILNYYNINFLYVVEFNNNKFLYYDNYEIIIDTINKKINNNEIIDINTINEPFKYVIPLNCPFILYKNNNIYHITYIIDNLDMENFDLNLLGDTNDFKSMVKTFKINPNNNFFPILETLEDIEIFTKLCLNYGVNHLNILFIPYIKDTYNLYYFDENKLKLFDKNSMLNNLNSIEINYKYIIEIINNNINDDVNKIKNKFNINNEYYEKLNNKILNCKNKDEIINQINQIKDILEIEIENYYQYFNTINYNLKLNNIINSQYIYILKLYTFLKNLSETENIDLFCSKIKIYSEILNIRNYKLKHNFEFIFEFLFGSIINKEQIIKYNKIINDNYENLIVPDTTIQYGGNSFYKLHHFMMGKGKSSVITPLLILYYSIIENKEIIIIIPEHLKNQTEQTLSLYIHIFEIQDKIKIMTDSECKLHYLQQTILFKNIENKIFIVDEFDYILDPLKSNFNLILSKNKNIFELSEYIFNVYFKNQIHEINQELYNINKIKYEIENIIEQLNNKKLKFNINWGINETNGIAIPFRNKDNPIINSYFSSVILTIYLTFYYYYVININKIDDLLVSIFNDVYLNENLDYISETENMNLSEKNIRIKEIIKNKYYDKIILYIVNQYNIAEFQSNTSFVDILNIDNINIIGYSGTMYIELPNIQGLNTPIEDFDEKLNVYYAILQSNITNNINFINYDVLIDVRGEYYLENNETTAINIHQINNRPVIFLDKYDNKLVINNNKIEKYNKMFNYENPFFYYSNSHIVGIDLNQDFYPLLKGLCLIDNNTTYTEVAQSIYRLRKLNMGHSIDFNIENSNINTTQLYEMLINNQNTNLKNKNHLMNLQFLKSNIRKKEKNNNNMKYINIHQEKIIYDFENEIQTINNVFYNIENITNEDIILYNNIILNQLNIFSIEHQKEQEHEQDMKKEQEQEHVQQLELEMELNYNFNVNTKIKCYLYSYNKNYFDVPLFDLNDDLFVYGNLEVMFSGLKLLYNLSGMIFVKQNEKLIIAPFYYLTLYDKDTEIFNHRFINIKTNKIDINLKNKFSNHILFQLLDDNNNEIHMYLSDKLKNQNDIDKTLLLILLIYRFYIYNNYLLTKISNFGLTNQIDRYLSKHNIINIF